MTFFAAPHLHDAQRWNGMRVGLLGGSFNPPHEGHVHISLAALQGLGLDAVWWLASPQNPLKQETPEDLDARLEKCRAIADHPKIFITALERELETRATFDTVRALKKHFPTTKFVWITGMDNALSLHKWKRWRELLSEICMAHLTRFPAVSLIQSCPVRMLGGQKHVMVDQAGSWPLDSGTTYWLLQKKMVDASSTSIREKHSNIR